MKIAFYSPHLCIRGTSVALYDYAFYNEKFLQNESVVIYNANDYRNNDTTIKKFNEHLNTVAIQTFPNLDQELSKQNCDAMYVCKSGYIDGVISQVCPTWVHCIGVHYQPHGERYVYASEWLTKEFGNMFPVVPYMIDLPNTKGDLRSDLGIPHDALVLGRTGGMDSWDIAFVNESFPRMLQREDLFFLLQNTPKFIEHPRVIYLPATSDMYYKVKFINTCDAMIHARSYGESFGVACGEFSVKNKPIITYGESSEKNHYIVLGTNAFYYRTGMDLVAIVDNFVRCPSGNWSAYKQFNPRAVMEKFQNVFIEGKRE